VKRLLLDQGVPRDAALIRRSLGWDVIDVGEIGLAAAADSQIIARAGEEGRVCVTLDSDFHALLAPSGAECPSVIRVRMESVGGEQMARLLIALWEHHETQHDFRSI
jgi:predicted nuclease of predicted toxin-antitoxin system